jgi:S-adenosylmethionine decarboxylase
MFPDKQLGPHRDWALEIEYLDRFFESGAAYTVGKVNGDHWLLYMTEPGDIGSSSSPWSSAGEYETENEEAEVKGLEYDLASTSLSEDSRISSLNVRPKSSVNLRGQRKEKWSLVSPGGLYTLPSPPSCGPPQQDYTIEILMTHLGAHARSAFFTPDFVDPSGEGGPSPGEHAAQLSDELGISEIFPKEGTELDAWTFSPCGYSANALVRWGKDAGGGASADVHADGNNGPSGVEDEKTGEGYYTIHVTPEDGWSYASFECNIPLAPRASHHHHHHHQSTDNDSSTHPDAHVQSRSLPDLRTLVQRVVRIFEPGRLSLTLFVASESESDAQAHFEGEHYEEEEKETVVDAAQRAFKAALARVPARTQDPGSLTEVEGEGEGNKGAREKVEKKTFTSYRRTDKINYGFGGYDLAFATFERMDK